MKPNIPSLSGKPRLSQSNRGIALILVLGFLVLITGLVVAFFSSVTSELSTSSSYANGASTKQLADSAVSTVMAQIKTATSGTNVAWASQPGMIRTYGKAGGTASADPLSYYKLYSSDNMEVTADQIAGFKLANDLKVKAGDNIKDWAGKPAIFTDLNAPVVSGTTTVYPIVDPTAVVEGFSLSVTDNPAATTGGISANPLPMPVKWIYVLKDGTLTAPVDGDKVALWTGAPTYKTPSATNPIVGRIAFWTDDESCKLNLNVASEPTTWDTPRAVTKQDLNFGKFQPANKEFQRYPGHPFMNSLSPVFFPSTDPSHRVLLTAAQKKAIYDLIPRVAWGGSQDATVAVTNTAGTATVTPDSDRLFANVDEALFTYPVAASPRPPVTSLIPQITPDVLQKARFFLTANSRAPEVNLFGQPRVSIWPVWKQVPAPASGPLSGYDKLAVFCATTGTGSSAMPYYFQRSDSQSPTTDYTGISRNQQLYKYLQTLTGKAVPGYGGNFLQKWSLNGTVDVGERDQVLTEIFDYIRCTNLCDPMTEASPFAVKGTVQTGQVTPIQIKTSVNDTQGFGRFHTISQFGFHFICSQSGTNGMTDQPKLSGSARAIEAAFVFSPFCPSAGWYQLIENVCYEVKFQSNFTLDGQDLKMQGGNSYVFGDATVGTYKPDPDIGGIWNGNNRGGGAGIRSVISGLRRHSGNNYPFVSTATPRVKISDPSKGMVFSGGTVVVNVYAGSTVDGSKLVQTFNLTFPSGTFAVPSLVTQKTEGFRGAEATDPVYWWTIQSRYSRANRAPHMPGPEYPNTSRQFAPSSGAPGFKNGGVFRAEDVVRTIVPDHGDFRLVAAQRNGSKDASGKEVFVPVNAGKWGSPDTKDSFQHIFVDTLGSHHYFGFCNEPGVTTNPAVIPASTTADQFYGGMPNGSSIQYHYSRLPEIRPGAGAQFNNWNDFDNGSGHWMDGPLINKPDEGNQGATDSPYTYFSWDFKQASNNFFSPSRIVPSPGMFGSLPTGVKRNLPWQTLLFRPEAPRSGKQNHPGTVSPKDHLIMDLFWMPVIEPYAISEPFSTSGKINMNYQIAPFTYIKRATAMYGALKSEEPLVLPNVGAKIYRLWDHETNDIRALGTTTLPNQCKDSSVATEWAKLYSGTQPYDKLRRPIDPVQTLLQADDRFDGVGKYNSAFAGKPDIFRSASEICELHLVRQDESLEGDYVKGTIYDGALMTGDNTRERPYTNLYAKLTTRSNVYNVHFRVQRLKKAASSSAAQWDDVRDQVVGEYRGSTMIERYVDPGDPKLPDFATTPNTSLDSFYKFRVLSTKKFAP